MCGVDGAKGERLTRLETPCIIIKQKGTSPS